LSELRFVQILESSGQAVPSSKLSNPFFIQPKICSLSFVSIALSTIRLASFPAMADCYLNTDAVAPWRRVLCNDIKPFSLSYEQAVDLVEYSLKASDHQTIWQWESFASFEIKLRGRSPENRNLLLGYFHLFSKTFFLGTFNEANCPVEVILKEAENDSRWVDNQKRKIQREGYAECKTFCKQSEGSSEIFIFESKTTDPKIGLREYLQVLAHEMTHSLFQIYVCRCRHKCWFRRETEYGVTGHGLPWQKCAQKVEEFLKKSLHLEANL